MTPQRKSAVERVASNMRTNPVMLANFTSIHADELHYAIEAVDQAERAIVAEGLLREAESTLRLIADLDDQNYDDSQFVSFCLNRIRHNVLPRLAEIRSFLSAEGSDMGDGIKRAFAAASVSMLRSQVERAAKRGQGIQLDSAQVEFLHKLFSELNAVSAERG